MYGNNTINEASLGSDSCVANLHKTLPNLEDVAFSMRLNNVCGEIVDRSFNGSKQASSRIMRKSNP